MHIEDLIARMKGRVKETYGSINGIPNESVGQIRNLSDLSQVSWFSKVKRLIDANKDRIDVAALSAIMAEFDVAATSQIKVHELVNILRYNCGRIFDDATLLGLQVELEALAHDHMVDYDDFVRIFFLDAA